MTVHTTEMKIEPARSPEMLTVDALELIIAAWRQDRSREGLPIYAQPADGMQISPTQDTDLDEARSTIELQKMEIAQLRDSFATQVCRSENLDTRVEALVKEQDRLLSEKQELREKLQAETRAHNESIAQVTNLQHDQEIEEQARAGLTTALEDREEELSELKAAVAKIQVEKADLESVHERLRADLREPAVDDPQLRQLKRQISRHIRRLWSEDHGISDRAEDIFDDVMATILELTEGEDPTDD